jgi:hypothetical protein
VNTAINLENGMEWTHMPQDRAGLIVNTAINLESVEWNGLICLRIGPAISHQVS